MGISGLLPLLKSIHKTCHLREFSGKTIGVDAYGWLHRGIVACAIDLALDKPTRKHIDFCLHRVRMLIHFGIKPYIVFDGDHLPGKDVTNKERAAKRRDSKRQGMELLKLGKTSQAHSELQKAVDVTPEMAKALIEELKQMNVDYVVAPYEADSQLVYLERKGLIDGIVSEDSDLLVFGAKCLITKLDPYGESIVINRSDFTACKDVSFVGWTDAEFRQMAILSGCDYLPNISKMGLMTAHRLLRKHKTLDRVLRQLQFDGKFKVPEGYAKDFVQAEMTFLYQWVYCPEAKRLVNFTEPESSIRLAEALYIGHHYDPEVAVGVATGDLHPNTKERLAVPGTMCPPSRPIMPKSRQSLVQTPDLKKSKSIDSFFKPRRIPLAELDINLFTPSPSQQQLMRQNHEQDRGSWSASPAPSRPIVPQSRTMPASAPRQTSQRVASTPILGRSVQRAVKRQRLCSDSLAILGADDGVRVEEGSSRFFDDAVCDSSPSANRTGTKRRASHDFGIFSDHSIEEAMTRIPDPSQTPVSQEAPLASSEKFLGRGSQEGHEKGSQPSLSSSRSKLSERDATSTPNTSYNSQTDVEDSQHSSIDDALPGKFRQLEEMFAYTTTPSKPSSPTHRIEKKKSKTARKPLESFANTKPTSSLGRIAKQAFSKANIAEFSWSKTKSSSKPLSGGKISIPKPSSPGSPKPISGSMLGAAAVPDSGSSDDNELPSSAGAMKQDKTSIKDTVSQLDAIVAKLSPKKRERKSVFSSSPPPFPSSPPRQRQQAGIAKGKGSEDLLVVPDSESEGGGEHSDDDDNQSNPSKSMTPKMNLSRFRLDASKLL